MTVDLRGMAYVQTRGPDGEPRRVVQARLRRLTTARAARGGLGD